MANVLVLLIALNVGIAAYLYKLVKKASDVSDDFVESTDALVDMNLRIKKNWENTLYENMSLVRQLEEAQEENEELKKMVLKLGGE